MGATAGGEGATGGPAAPSGFSCFLNAPGSCPHPRPGHSAAAARFPASSRWAMELA